MPDPLSAAERYRSDAARLSELAKNAANPFFHDYYRRLAQRYLLHAENQERIAWISEGGLIPDSPDVQAAPEADLPGESSSSNQPAAPAPLQPAQGPTRAPRRKRHHHRDVERSAARLTPDGRR
jgi:hypothetical protein